MGKQSTPQFSALNCIDLSNPDINQSVNLLKEACLDSGFFYVVNHGISQEFMDEVFAQSKKFFSLPHNEKMKTLRNEQHRGYTPVLDELLDPENQVHVGDYKEGYYIGVEKGEDDPQSKKPFYGPNNWPAPDVLPGWRETMEKFHLETLYVSICRDRDAKPQKWEDVAPLKGAFIVNLGDMLERWSNCVFKSTLHRVLGNGQGRYSIAYFLEPSLDCLVECLPTCKSDSNPPKYPPILCHDYMTQRYKDTHADLNIYKKQQA
ncbi:hypothetical protein JHK86_000078 [Glycine max]|nr:hypothetical protein JHK86_000078 [Glycine max]